MGGRTEDRREITSNISHPALWVASEVDLVSQRVQVTVRWAAGVEINDAPTSEVMKIFWRATREAAVVPSYSVASPPQWSSAWHILPSRLSSITAGPSRPQGVVRSDESQPRAE